MDFGKAIATCFRKYVTFKGRAPRSEYWWFFLFTVIVQLCTSTLDAAVMGTGDEALKPFTSIQGIILFLPSLAVMVRRFHDINYSGWVPLGMLFAALVLTLIAVALDSTASAVFFSFVVLLAIAFIYFLCVGGDRGDNKFGPDPLAPADAPQTPIAPTVT